ncbi:glycosyltransferase family 2 protein [Lutibacter sp. TH_r2]|uniref:glycosyltransferase family 2 protein n=1 Tax=Lutibacter sp. TH_r2 TaxID=3082083 RepID=UPI0029559A6C|nr:glycosyltransferase family 2 protein [Lutibacter sp. TH_r2]MDV7187442.1 glycosyltransferase family 2 protein [Lutibacter sp. TH_r2]
MNNYPKISIVTPSYNQGKFIEKTIQSVLDQDYPNFEYIIIDGGSTDETVEIIKKYQNKLHYWVSEKDNGQSDAINKGFLKATGDIYYWINSDDYLLPNTFKTIGEYTWGKEIGAVVGIGHIININDTVVYTPEYYNPITTKSLFKWSNKKDFMQPACFFTKQAWEQCGPLNESLFFCMDVDLWIKISKTFKLDRIEQSFAHAYTHPTAKTTAEVDKMKLETCLMVASHGGFEEAKVELDKFYEKIRTEKIKSNMVLEHFNFKKLLKLTLKKIYLNLFNRN